jgi:transcriptional regulator with XRE-family HTH domain
MKMKKRDGGTVVNAIKGERKAQKVTQKEMGRRLGMSLRQYQRMEGTDRMRVSDMEDIFKVLGLELSVVKVQKEIKLI